MALTRSPCSHVSGSWGNSTDQSDMIKMVKHTIEAKVWAVTYVNSIQPRYTKLATATLSEPGEARNQRALCLRTMCLWHNEKCGAELPGVVGDSTNRKSGTGTWETRHFSEQMRIIHKLIWKWSGVGYARSSNETTNNCGAKERNFGHVFKLKGKTA